MTSFPQEILPYLGYAAPPMVGAFIGYLTNRVAIRMLFRPLKAWRIFGFRVPMTPGVIPSKRHELAVNMGEVVGDHLLTSKEIGKGLQQEVFQNHLYSLIQGRVEGVLQRDLGNLASTIPQKFKVYFDIGTKTVCYQLKEQIHTFIHSPDFAETVDSAIDNRLELFLEQNVGTILTGDNREKAYLFLENNIARMFESDAMEQWVEDFVYHKVSGILKNEKCLNDILPESLIDFLLQMVESQTPELLSKFSNILTDPVVKKKIIEGVKKGVENFIASLGPMSTMVNNFISMETVELKVTEYFNEKESDIVEWLQNEEMQEKISASTLERLRHILNTPVVDYIKEGKSIDVSSFCNTLSKQLLALLREEGTVDTISKMVQENIEMYIEGGSTELNKIIQDLFGEESIEKSQKWLSSEGLSLLRTNKTRKAIDSMVDSLISSILQKPIGRLSNILPAGVREGLYNSLRRLASHMLAVEVPGLVHSLNIRNVVTEKVDSLDLLRLEGLLLSIMEEQFKYINLFGALLGFIIGCCNILFISLI